MIWLSSHKPDYCFYWTTNILSMSWWQKDNLPGSSRNSPFRQEHYSNWDPAPNIFSTIWPNSGIILCSSRHILSCSRELVALDQDQLTCQCTQGQNRSLQDRNSTKLSRGHIGNVFPQSYIIRRSLLPTHTTPSSNNYGRGSINSSYALERLPMLFCTNTQQIHSFICNRRLVPCGSCFCDA